MFQAFQRDAIGLAKMSGILGGRANEFSPHSLNQRYIGSTQGSWKL